MLGLFLQAQGHPLPQHTKAKSASAIRALFKHLLLVNPKANSRNKADSTENLSCLPLLKDADQCYKSLLT